jgi:hypothetical protein
MLCVFLPLYSVYCLCVNVYYYHQVSTQPQLNNNNNNNNKYAVSTVFAKETYSATVRALVSDSIVALPHQTIIPLERLAVRNSVP